MRTTDRESIRKTCFRLLESHNGGIGNGAPDEQFAPCECEQCQRARTWLDKTRDNPSRGTE